MKVYDNGGPDGKADVLEMEPIDAREAVQNDPGRYSLDPPADDGVTKVSLKGGKKGKDEAQPAPEEPPPA